jgi:outer membrane receptor protein involved in Fe transport
VRVSDREIMALPRRAAEDALRLVPGLTLVQHGSEGKGQQFFLRGFDASHGSDFEVSVDGVPVNEWSNVHAQGYVDLGFVIPELIETVEVTKGPFALHQGPFATAGSAEYRLGVSDRARGLRSAYTLGSTFRHRALVTYSPWSSSGGQFVAAEALRDDGFGENRSVERGVVVARGRIWDGGADGSLSLLAAVHVARFELPGTIRHRDVVLGNVGFFDSYDDAGEGLSARGLLALTYELDGEQQETRLVVYAGRRRLSLLENYTGYLLDPVNGDRREQRHDALAFGARFSTETALTNTFELHAGLGVHGETIAQQQERPAVADRAVQRERALTAEQAIGHAAAGIHWDVVPAWQVAAGLRLDAVGAAVRERSTAEATRSDPLLALLPRVTMQWRIVDSLRAFAAYGRGYRPPEARAFTSFEAQRTGFSEEIRGSRDAALTFSDSLELGARFAPGRELGVTAAAFATFVASESVLDHVSGQNLELNSTRRVGGELEVSSQPCDGLALAAHVTWVDARFVDSGNPVPFAPPLTAGARAIVTHPSGLRAGARVTALAARPLPHGARGEALVSTDATLGYQWQSFALELELENLLDRPNREGEYHYASHWQRGETTSAIPALHYAAGPPFNARLTLSAVF